jgi:ribose/xylose/arabinose/galactoside ABC-type transport system permease subunit
MRERFLPLLATIVVFAALFVTGGLLYNNFFSTLVLGHLLVDNAFIITAAIGTTFVILSGGIDLSIGSMIGFVGVVMANLDAAGWHPLASAALMLSFGVLFGAFQGFIIDFCEIQPFIITLAGLFMLRGSCFMVNLNSVPLRHQFVEAFAGANIPLPGGGFLASSAIVMLVALAVAIVIAHFTRFGTNIYAIGGDRASAVLMGVPMRRTIVSIYALGGFYSALGGVIYALYTSSGYPLAGTGNELNAIASVVLGGTLLTGGVGMVAGTLFGGMILGLIATLINFNGSLNGAWIMISGGVLLFLFIVMQRFLVGSFSLGRAARAPAAETPRAAA